VDPSSSNEGVGKTLLRGEASAFGERKKKMRGFGVAEVADRVNRTKRWLRGGDDESAHGTQKGRGVLLGKKKTSGIPRLRRVGSSKQGLY